MKHNEPFEDDGRTVADMSGIEHDSIWLPRRRKQGHTPAQQPQQAVDRPWEEDPQLTGKERLWAILGALKATLSPTHKVSCYRYYENNRKAGE